MSKPKTLNETQAKFELEKAGHRRAWYTRSAACEKIVKFFGKDRAVDSIFRADVQAFEEQLKTQGYSDATCEMTLTTGNQWYKWMEVLGLV